MKRTLILGLMIPLILVGCNKRSTQEPNQPITPPEIESTINSNTVNVTAAEDEEFNLYQDSVFDFEFLFPKNWTYQATDNFTLTDPQSQQTISLGKMVSLTPSNSSNQNINVVLQDLSGRKLDFAAYTELSLSQLKQVITDLEIISEEDITIAGQPAKSIEYTGQQGGQTFKWFQVWFVKDQTAYLMTYTALTDAYETHIQAVRSLVESFTFKTE